MTAPLPQPATSEIARLFERQSAHAPHMARTGVTERRERLRRLRRAITGRREAIVTALHADLCRPRIETELTEIYCTLAEIDHALPRLARWMRPERVRGPLLLFGTTGRIVHEPRGVALIMGPWNYPFALVVNPLVAAISAGNCVVLKPSEKAPATSGVIRDLIADAFDPAEVTVMEGGPDVARALLEQPFDHICFTGSTHLGRVVMAAAAKHLATVTLELGGKCPAVVDASADTRAAAERIVLGKFMNAGQTCLAPDYVLVHEQVADELLAALGDTLARFYGGDEPARAASPDFGRIVDAQHFLRLRTLFEEAVAAGARAVTGGRFDAAARYVAPTVLTGVRPSMAVMQEEIFGPLLPVLTYRSTDEAVAAIRAGEKPLAMYVFARDGRVTEALLRGTSAGATVVNNVGMHYFHHGLPFGGVGASGLGAYHGVYGFRAFSHARPVLRQYEPALVRFFFPPYRGRLHELARRVLRLLE